MPVNSTSKSIDQAPALLSRSQACSPSRRRESPGLPLPCLTSDCRVGRPSDSCCNRYRLPHKTHERRTARLLQGQPQISQSHTAHSRPRQPESVRSVQRLERFRTPISPSVRQTRGTDRTGTAFKNRKGSNWHQEDRYGGPPAFCIYMPRAARVEDGSKDGISTGHAR